MGGRIDAARQIADSDTFSYDDAGRQTQAVSGRYNNTCDFTFDNGGRKTGESLTVNIGAQQIYTTARSYDAANRKTQITYPDATVVDREYTDRGQLKKVKYAGTTVDTRAYDAGGRLQTITHGNAIVTTRAVSDDNLVQSITRTGLTGADFTYDYDANKNKLKETISGVMQPYGFNSATPAAYDDENRLTGWNRDDAQKNQNWLLSYEGDWNIF